MHSVLFYLAGEDSVVYIGGLAGESLGITIHFRSLIDKRCCLCREVKTCVTSTWQPVANYVDGRGRRLGKSILVLDVAVGLVIGADIFH